MRQFNDTCYSDRSEKAPEKSFMAFRMTERTLLFKFFVLALILVLCGLFSSCQSGACGTTETGNPICTADSTDSGDDDSSSGNFTCSFCYDEVDVSVDDTDGDGPDAMSTETLSEVGEVLFGICGRAAECYNVEELDCIEAAYTELNMLNVFGADFVTYTDFEELQTGVDAGLVVVSDSTLESCTDAIDAVSCEELDADEAYDESIESYDRLYLSVPTACRQVF